MQKAVSEPSPRAVAAAATGDDVDDADEVGEVDSAG
jgi:hypothetical protein